MTNNNETPIIVGNDIQPPADVQQTAPQNQLLSYHYFPSAVYMIEKPEFLADAKSVTEKYLKEIKKTNPQPHPIYPIYQTGNLFQEPKMQDLAKFILESGWNLLSEQGHAMNGLTTYFMEMWCQEYHKTGNQEEHVHGFGSQLIGFYFIDCPKDSSRIVIHDPRPSRKQINLGETNVNNATFASTMINFQPKPGQLFFTNSWLPHGFTRHAAKQPMRFIHFNIGVMVNNNQQQQQPQQQTPQANIV
jgi:hypothetical protein